MLWRKRGWVFDVALENVTLQLRIVNSRKRLNKSQSLAIIIFTYSIAFQPNGSMKDRF